MGRDRGGEGSWGGATSSWGNKNDSSWGDKKDSWVDEKRDEQIFRALRDAIWEKMFSNGPHKIEFSSTKILILY